MDKIPTHQQSYIDRQPDVGCISDVTDHLDVPRCNEVKARQP